MATFAIGARVQHFKTGQFGRVAEIDTNAYTGLQYLRVKLHDGVAIWSAAYQWGVVEEVGAIVHD